MEINPIKVLSICTSDTSGGAARAAYRIHRGVRDLGIESSMFVKDKSSSDSFVHSLDEFVPHGKLYKFMDYVALKLKNKWQHFQWREYPDKEDIFMSDMRSTRIHHALDSLNCNVLHLHWLNLRFFPLKELMKVKKPIIWTLHDSWPFCGVCHYFFECENYKNSCGNCPNLHSGRGDDLSNKVWSKKKAIYKNLDLHIVAPSHWLAECAKKSSLFRDFPVSVIPNCIDTDVFAPLKEISKSSRFSELVANKGKTSYILFGAVNATTDKIKGYSHLISALHYLVEHSETDNLALIVFGVDKPLDSIPSDIPAYYVGYVSDTEDLVSLYNISDVTVVPSLTENLSCTIMESLSCGTPVVAFNIGGNGDMIDHMENGYLARKMDDRDLADGIMWCIESNRDHSLSKKAREKVIKNFTPEIVCKKYKDLYSSLIKG